MTLWLSADATDAWRPSPSGRPGGQKRFSDEAIETALVLRLVFGLPLRQTEGFLRSVLALVGADLNAPDHTTLSRRSQQLAVMLRRIPATGPIHLIVDSTGLSIVGQGAWAVATHGGRGRRGWRKLHLGVDQSGVILVHTLTEATGDAATTALDLLTAVEGPLVRVTADAASDTVAVYETATARGATVVIPPARTANVSAHGPRSPARDRTITVVKQLGRRRWKKVSGYHRQGRVENTVFRYTSIIGDGLRARSPAGQGSEAVLGCEILNRMRPPSADQCRLASAGKAPVDWHRAGQSRFVQQRHGAPPTRRGGSFRPRRGSRHGRVAEVVPDGVGHCPHAHRQRAVGGAERRRMVITRRRAGCQGAQHVEEPCLGAQLH